MLTFADRVFELSQIWREATYNFPYWDVLDATNWDISYQQQLEKMTKVTSLREHYLVLMHFTAGLTDGHSVVIIPEKLREYYGTYPIGLRVIEDEIILVQAAAEYNDYLLQPIKKINGLPVKDFLEEKIAPYVWHARFEHVLYHFEQSGAFILDGKPLLLEFASGKMAVEAAGKTMQWEKHPLYPTTKLFLIAKNNQSKFYLTDDKVAYIKLTSLLNSNVVDLFYQTLKRFSGSRKIVFDVRNTRGGNRDYADMLAQAFYKGAFKTEICEGVVHDSRLYGKASYRSLQMNEETDLLRQMYMSYYHQTLAAEAAVASYPDYQGLLQEQQVSILMDDRTYGAAENFLINFDAHKRGNLIGQPSAGSVGQPLYQRLASGGAFMISTQRFSYPDGTAFHNVGVQPTIKMENSLEDRHKGFDYVLEQALQQE